MSTVRSTPFSYFSTDTHAGAHFECVAGSRIRGARYLIQLYLCNLDVYPFGLEASWDVTTPEGPMHCTWSGGSFDAATKIEIQVSRFEMMAGPRFGQVYEDLHQMRMWNWSD